MPKFLQLRWSDEPADAWRTVRTIEDGIDPAKVLREAEVADATAQRHYGHSFHAVFRVVDTAAEAVASSVRGHQVLVALEAQRAKAFDSGN